MRVFGIVSTILQYVPQVLDLVERFFPGEGRSADKRIAASKEILEIVLEGINRGRFAEYGGLNGFDVAALAAAIKDEKQFVEKVARVNDAIVDLMNYIEKFKNTAPAPTPAGGNSNLN